MATHGESALPIRSIVFGVRYEPQFGIQDKAGGFLDQVVRAKSGVFGPEVFPATEYIQGDRRLVNPETGDHLLVSYNQIVLQKTVGETRDLGVVASLASVFESLVLDQAKRSLSLASIDRYGFLLRFAECGGTLSRSPVDQAVPNQFPQRQDATVRFSYRLATGQGYTKRGVNDYRQVIYTLHSENPAKLLIAVDYQEYFDPVLDRVDLEKRPFAGFVNQGVGYHTGIFAKWIHEYTASPVASS